MASEARTPYYLRRPTGVLGLDIDLGGGLHAGGGTQIYGAESVGKTHLAFRTCGEHQRIYGEDASILVYSTEIRTDKSFARKSGFCVGYSEAEIEEFETMRKIQGLPPFTKEEKADLLKSIGNVVLLAASTADDGLEALVDALREDVFNIVVIESLGALLPKDQEERDIGDMKPGGSARVVTDFQNRIYPLFMLDREDGRMLETTIIGINQARAKMGFTGRGPTTKPAADAYAWKHGQLVSIELTRGKNIRPGDRKPVIGKEVNWKLTKGKAGTHDGKNGQFNFFHLAKGDPVLWSDVLEHHYGGIDTATEAVDTAKRLGVIEMSGSWATWSYAEGKQIRKQGINNIAEDIAGDPKLLEILRDQCMLVSGVMVRYR